MTFDPASRFQLVPEAQQNPGMCFITRVTQGPFVDTGLVLNKFDQIWSETNQSRIYLSVAVLREMAEGAGLFDELKSKYQNIQEEVHAHGWAEGVSESGELVAVADRLVGAVERLHDGLAATGPEASGTDEGDEPGAFVLDEAPGKRPQRSQPVKRASGGQSSSSGRKRRSVGVSSDSGDESGNPFRL